VFQMKVLNAECTWLSGSKLHDKMQHSASYTVV